MRDGQGRGGKGDLHAVPRSAFCRPHTRGLWLLGAHPHAAGARCCPATPRLSPRAHPSGSPQGPPAAQLGPLACVSLCHGLSPGARTLNPCSATVPTGHQSPLPCSSPQQPRGRPSWCRVQPHGPSSLCPLGEGVGIPRRQTARRAVTVLLPTPAGRRSGWRTPLQPLSPATAKGRKWKNVFPLARARAGATWAPVCPPRGHEGQKAACGRQGQSVPGPCMGCPHSRGPTQARGGHLPGTTH